jgi:ABC-type bacteriocin/lantibiotic exporter with double-glycine peptidase domain
MIPPGPVMKMLKVLALTATLSTAGCILSLGSAEPTTQQELQAEQGWILVDDVHHVAQEHDEDCGAAALSSVLARWGVDVPVATLREECTKPDVPGLLAGELRDAARRRGLSAYVFEGSLADIEHELRRGRPVVVGLVKSLGPISATHYEVIVGLRPDAEVAAVDPAQGLVRDTLTTFAAEWAATRGVTLVVFRREETPVPAAVVIP